MKFPRNARMLKGHLDFAPFASVFFCLLIFVVTASLEVPASLNRIIEFRDPFGLEFCV